MKTFNITFKKEKALYIELYEYIKDLILTKKLLPNEKLPSKRVLSTYLDISLNTVIEAYNLLLDEELIVSKPKVGYFVTSYQLPKDSNKEFRKLEIKDKNIIYDFSTKNTDASVFPFYTFNKICKNVIYKDDISLKSDNLGNIKLRNTIANYLYETKGITINPSHIIIGSGIEYLLTLLVHLMNINKIGIENPGYDKIYKILKNNNKEITLLDLDNDGVIPNKNIDAIYITPQNQFPTGIKMSMKRKIELANIFKGEKYIIEDDFDSEFKYLSNKSISLFELNKDNTVLLSTYSRTIFPSVRISYMVLPDNLYNKYLDRYSFYSTTVSTLDQLILNEFIASGAYSRHLNKTKALYKQKRDLIISLLKPYKNISIDYQNSYLSLIIEVKNLNKKDFIEKCKKDLIDISLMEDYYMDNKKDDRIIIGYSSIDINKIKEGITLLIKNMGLA